MNVKNNFDEILINHAINTFKNRSVKIMLKKGIDFEQANDQGVTPIGQAMISKNAEALDLLLQHKADIHKNCVVDPRVSTKKMKPLHYFTKMLRIKGIQKGDDEILKII